MQSYVANLTTEYEAKKSELDRMVKEADGLREGMEGFRSTTVVSDCRFGSAAVREL